MEINVTRQVETPGWFLKDQAAMLEVLDRLDGWDGDVNKTDGAYKLVLRQSGKNTITAPVLHWLVPDGGELKLMDRAQFKDAGYRADNLPPEAEPDPIEQSRSFTEEAEPEAAVDDIKDDATGATPPAEKS